MVFPYGHKPRLGGNPLRTFSRSEVRRLCRLRHICSKSPVPPAPFCVFRRLQKTHRGYFSWRLQHRAGPFQGTASAGIAMRTHCVRTHQSSNCARMQSSILTASARTANGRSKPVQPGFRAHDRTCKPADLSIIGGGREPNLPFFPRYVPHLETLQIRL